MFELVIHLMIAAVFIMELLQHWSHHRKKKHTRDEPKYTLDEAKIILFETVALADPEIFALPRPVKTVPDQTDMSLLHTVAKRN